MRVVVAGCLLLLAGLATRAEDDPDKKPPSPKAQYEALMKEHGAVVKEYIEVFNKAETPEARQKVMKDKAPKLEALLARFLALAEKHPKDAVAVDALLLVAGDNLASRAGGASKKKALAVLARDHVTSDKMDALCQTLGHSYEQENETLLRAVLAKNPNKSVQAEACLALVQHLRQRAAVARQLAANAELLKRLEEVLGKETAAEIKKADADKLDAQGEKLARQFADKYVGDMKPDRLVGLCQQLKYSSDKGSEALLRTLLKHDKREVQGVAILTLGQVLKQQADTAADKDAKQATKLRGESEKLFERATEKYADVKAGFRGTVGEVARSELYEIRHLAVGKPAPEIESEDQDGKKFKLSDCKGKVVMLDFWSQF
jgi:hypothetical protein